LGVFEEATNILSGDKYPTISILHKIVQKLIIHTRDFVTQSNYIKEAQTEILFYLDKYWGDFKVTSLFATFLDPRYKDEILEDYPDAKQHFFEIL